MLGPSGNEQRPGARGSARFPAGGRTPGRGPALGAIDRFEALRRADPQEPDGTSEVAFGYGGDGLLWYNGYGELDSLTYRVVIAPKGWAHIENLRRTVSPSNSAFIAMWFDEKTHDLRERGLRPALSAAGYDPLPIDEKLHSNRIDAEIVATIRQRKLVVADLHGGRGGVYYESGFAMGLNIPVFWTCHQSDLDQKLIHFDVRQYPFEVWDGVNWDDFAKRLRYRIESVLGRGSRLQ